ncbi:MAG: chromosome segregation protein SMC [Candidatus Saccharicenans sp.]
MFIKKLEVQGFKSFADRTKILFHPGITAIVGPNGTGKSNIVDAILWSLGGMRLKSVRGDRTEDIIFNGNAKRPPLSLAEVIITLGNEEELVISHRVFRSGESEYRLNGKAVRLKDIQDELWKHSIGEKEYFVIEQGAIGSFVTSKPQEKRILIEEAAGTAYYKDKKRQAESKLESSEQNLIRLEDIIIEVEKSKNSLYRQALAAARFRRLRERLRELTAHHFYRKMRQLDSQQENIKNQLDKALSIEQELVSAVKVEETTLSKQRKEFWDLEKQLKDRQEKVFSLKGQLSRLEGEIERENKKLEYLETTIKKADSDRSDLTKEIKDLETEISGTLSRLSGLEKDLAEKTLAAENSRRQLEEVRILTREKEAGLAELRKAQLTGLQKHTDTRNNLYRLEKDLELLAKQEEKLKQEKEGLLSQKDQTEVRISALLRDLENLELQKKEQEKILQELLEKYSQAEEEISQQEADLINLNRQLEELSLELQALNKIAEAERQSSNQDLLPEALGWFSELIEIPPEEAPLFDIFWKEEGKAQACQLETFKNLYRGEIKTNILLLRENAGYPVPNSIVKEDGVLGFLKRKVKAKPELEKYLGSLEDAVLTKDLLTAIRLWEKYPQVNFITPGGDLLESSGLLRPAQKKEGLFVINQEKKRLEKEIDRLQAIKDPLLKKLGEKNKEKEELGISIESQKKNLSEIERTLYDLQREKKFAQSELEKLGSGLTILEKEEKIQQEEKNKLSEKKVAASSLVQQAELELESLKEKIRQEEEILIQYKEKEKEREQDYYQLKSERELLLEKTNGIRSALQSLEKRQQAIKSKLGQIEIEVFAGEEEKSNLRRQIEELKQRTAILKEQSIKEEQELTELEQQVQTRKKELDEIESKLQFLRQQEELAREERMKIEIQKAEAERDRLNLEETCWQELKKNLLELKQEIEELSAATVGTSTAPEIPEGLEEVQEGEAEEIEESVEEKTEEKTESKIEEKPKERKKNKQPVPARELSDEDLEKELEATSEVLQRYRAINLMAEEEYLEQKKRYDFLIQQRQDLRDSINSTQEAIKKIDEESKTQFLTALAEVNKNFQEVFSLLFRGGTAEVKLLEPENPLDSGVEIIAQPPGKRVQNLALLSGGEKSLTSLAFLFALFRYKPSPFCILDEVDAALDEINLARFLNLMKAIKHQTQFIIITHSYKTMEVADFIYGTTMEEPNITKVYSVRMEKKEEIPAAEENNKPSETLSLGNPETKKAEESQEEKLESS